ncbi:MAG: LacI family DNA-binding transcriptional regulator [Bacteroidetes bacterium]|nr:LacI family DNA-binding transcriptional regulator [Bacteroidota bacterium]
MKTKLKDIAEKTGFSINTVSRALRDDTKISSDTRGTIQRVSKEMGYIPNFVAGSMRSNRTNIIGVISADSSNPFFAEVLLGIEDTARKNNYHILLMNTEERAENESEAIILLQGRQVDGIIVIPVFHDNKNLQMYKKLKIPYIFAGRRIVGIQDHSILHDDIKGSREVIEYLLGNGHKRILYLVGPENISNTVDRLEGLMQAYRNSGLEINQDLIIPTKGHINGGYSSVNEALNKGLDFTAVACFNDLLAMGALKSLHENGRRVPDDVEVIGFDNLYMAQFMQPRLTTVDVPKYKLGQIAVEELLMHIEDEDIPYKTTNMDSRLIFRETTRSPRVS